MIKLQNLVPIKEGGKLFGPRAKRVSTQEMLEVFEEISALVESIVRKSQLSRFLPDKKDHGDIDIITLVKGSVDLRKKLPELLKNQMIEFSKNGNVNSVLFHSNVINKDVHVDFIQVTDGQFQSYIDYYSFNDFSGIVGIFAKKLNFVYGSHGFGKKFEDIKKQHHVVHVTGNLMDGLRILGYTNVEKNFNNIKNIDDIINFIVDSPLFDSDYFNSDEMNQSDRKSEKGRPVIKYCIDKIREMHITRKVADDDYFFKKLYPNLYEKALADIEKINKETYAVTKYNGQWVIEKLNITKPGPIVGKILKAIHDKFGDTLESAEESVVLDYIHSIMDKLK